MADFKKLHLDTAAATNLTGLNLPANGAQYGASLRSLTEDDGSATISPASSEQADKMQQRNHNGGGSIVAAPMNCHGAIPAGSDNFDRKDSHLVSPTSSLNEQSTVSGEGSARSNSPTLATGVETFTKKFPGPSMTQQVADASAAALRSRHGSDADRLIYNPITGVPFRGNSPDRANPTVQARLNRSPLIKPLSDQIGKFGKEDSADPQPVTSPRSTPARAAAAKMDYQALDQDEDDESAIQIMSQSDPGLIRQDSMDRSASFHLPRRGSGRRPSRRSSTRSFSNTGPSSPAASFLASFTRDTAAVAASPDAEGREIGDETRGRYVIGQEIGRGGFSIIKEAQTMSNGTKIHRAVKILPKQPKGVPEDENPKMQSQFEHERFIWSYLPKGEPTILPLIAVFENDFATFCITKNLPGGSVQNLIRRHRRSSTTSIASTASGASGFGSTKGIPFSFTRRYIFQLATALRILHEDLSIVHRDVKLENCLLENHATDHSPDSGSLMLCDFGMADFISPEDRERYCPQGSHGSSDQSSPNSSPKTENKFVGPAPSSASLGKQADIGVPGSLPYASPELLQATQPIFHPSIDMWAFGVACYAMIAGRLPFNHSIPAFQREQIINGEWNEENLVAALEGEVHSDEVVQLIKGCLNIDPEQRWTVGRVLACNFLAPERSVSLN